MVNSMNICDNCYTPRIYDDKKIVWNRALFCSLSCLLKYTLKRKLISSNDMIDLFPKLDSTLSDINRSANSISQESQSVECGIDEIKDEVKPLLECMAESLEKLRKISAKLDNLDYTNNEISSEADSIISDSEDIDNFME